MTSPYPLSSTDPIGLGIFSNLNLSSSQQSQIQSIVGGAQNGQTPFSQVVSQVEALLSPAQQSTFKNDLHQLELQAGGTHRRHHGLGSSVNAASSLLGSMGTDAFGASTSTAAATTTTDAFGNAVTTPGSALADVFGVQSTSNASTPSASNVYNPFQTVAARYQVQQQLQASLMDLI